MGQTEKATIIRAIAAAIKTLTIDIRNPAKMRATEKMKAIKKLAGKVEYVVPGGVPYNVLQKA